MMMQKKYNSDSVLMFVPKVGNIVSVEQSTFIASTIKPITLFPIYSAPHSKGRPW